MGVESSLLWAFFDSARERVFLSWYRKVFSVPEIEQNVVLQWVFGATIFSHFIAFSYWMTSQATTVDSVRENSHVCWPYFQNCSELLFLRALPYGYSQNFLYMIFMGVMLLSVYGMYRKDWLLAHVALVPLFLWHTFVTFFLTMELSGNYEYYLFIYSLILLFFPHKEFFLKLAVVWFYVLSTVAKIHETWIVGTYFSPLKTGLPLFPDWSIPLVTNALIFMEMVGSWFLLSSKKVLQRITTAFFVWFHLYSGLIVEYHYPATVLPTLLILFGPMYRYTPLPFDRKSLFGWTLIVLMLVSQFIPRLISGDEKLTLEGNQYGLYMFEANHQCVSIEKIYFNDGTTKDLRYESASARDRCDPYKYWSRMKSVCDTGKDRIKRIAWTFDHSVDGGPFLRIVDVPNSCDLKYRPLTHNTWIKTESDNPPVIGYPVENIYR